LEKIKMGFEEIFAAIFLIIVLIMVLPGFITSNVISKQFTKNLFIWTIIVASIVLVAYLIY
tara:strand:- start:1243 stop:1425 length:183 start_codon:yes stop_codon:yes gene_type:complete